MDNFGSVDILLKLYINLRLLVTSYLHMYCYFTINKGFCSRISCESSVAFSSYAPKYDWFWKGQLYMTIEKSDIGWCLENPRILRHPYPCEKNINKSTRNGAMTHVICMKILNLNVLFITASSSSRIFIICCSKEFSHAYIFKTYKNIYNSYFLFSLKKLENIKQLAKIFV